jgi:predicted kinase
METKVSDWLNEGRISLDDMASILSAYQGSNSPSATELLVELENYTIKNFQRLSSNQAANIIINHNKKMQSAELTEICEKRVANGYAQIID